MDMWVWVYVCVSQDGWMSVCLSCVYGWIVKFIRVNMHTHTHTSFLTLLTHHVLDPQQYFHSCFSSYLEWISSSKSLEKKQSGFCVVSWCRLLLGTWVGSTAPWQLSWSSGNCLRTVTPWWAAEDAPRQCVAPWKKTFRQYASQSSHIMLRACQAQLPFSVKKLDIFSGHSIFP